MFGIAWCCRLRRTPPPQRSVHRGKKKAGASSSPGPSSSQCAPFLEGRSSTSPRTLQGGPPRRVHLSWIVFRGERCPQVVVLGLQALEPLRIFGPPQLRLGFLGQGKEEASVPAPYLIGIACLLELLLSVLPDGLEQPVSHPAASCGLKPNKRLLHQSSKQIKAVALLDIACSYFLGRL